MDSSIGRFTSKDPILYLNLYRYVKNNPMRYKDYSGKIESPENYGLCNLGNLSDFFSSLNEYFDYNSCNKFFKDWCANGNNFEQELNEHLNEIYIGTSNQVNEYLEATKNDASHQYANDEANIIYDESSGQKYILLRSETGLANRNLANGLVHELFHSCGGDYFYDIDKMGDGLLLQNCVK